MTSSKLHKLYLALILAFTILQANSQIVHLNISNSAKDVLVLSELKKHSINEITVLKNETQTVKKNESLVTESIEYKAKLDWDKREAEIKNYGQGTLFFEPFYRKTNKFYFLSNKMEFRVNGEASVILKWNKDLLITSYKLYDDTLFSRLQVQCDIKYSESGLPEFIGFKWSNSPQYYVHYFIQNDNQIIYYRLDSHFESLDSINVAKISKKKIEEWNLNSAGNLESHFVFREYEIAEQTFITYDGLNQILKSHFILHPIEKIFLLKYQSSCVYTPDRTILTEIRYSYDFYKLKRDDYDYKSILPSIQVTEYIDELVTTSTITFCEKRSDWMFKNGRSISGAEQYINDSIPFRAEDRIYVEDKISSISGYDSESWIEYTIEYYYK